MARKSKYTNLLTAPTAGSHLVCPHCRHSNRLVEVRVCPVCEGTGGWGDDPDSPDYEACGQCDENGLDKDGIKALICTHCRAIVFPRTRDENDQGQLRREEKP